MNNKKKKYIIILFLLLLSLSVGFALLQTNLKINGSSKIQGSSWDIHFENLNITDGSVELSTGDVAASIQTSRTDITYTVTLNTPGDYYEFTVDAVNAGTVDGMVESVTSKLNNESITSLPSYLNYSVTYETNDEIQINHLLKAGDSEKYKVRIEYKRDINSTDMPTTSQTLSLSFGVVYVQADSNGIEVEHPRFVYTVNKYDSSATNPKWNAVWLNQAIHETIPYFETPAEALSAIATASNNELPFYLKHKVENGIVTESYVEFVVTETMAQANSGMVSGIYSLKGGKTKENGEWIVDNNYICSSFEISKVVLKNAFGYSVNPARCSEGGTNRGSYFTCNVPGLTATVQANCYVGTSNLSGSGCEIDTSGSSKCSWN